jgi:hypothetical protein
MHELTRRQLVRSGLALGAFFAIAGCETSPRRARTADAHTPNPADWEFKSHRPRWLDGADLSGSGAAPGVVSRASWTSARPIISDTNPMNGISRITVHHDGMNAFTNTSQPAAAQRLESIRRAHVSGNGWADIGYHYVIDPAGRVWEARPVSLQGAHVKDNNEHNLGVMVMGNYDEQSPTNASARALDDFVAAMMRKYRVPVARVYTHQEIKPTACPGRSLQYLMESTRSRGGALARA